jgi:predicted N-acyltransferase
MAGSKRHLQIVHAMSDIAKSDWDACATTDATAGNPENPFVAYDFLDSLERSGTVAERTGWTPHHLVARRDDRIVGVVPCYLKSHSRGEYVFDHGWAEAYTRAGGQYYPKLQVAVPFTPATGPRLMARRDEPEAQLIRAELADGLIAQCARESASSVHVTFAPADDWELLHRHGFLARTDIQFHWENQGYATFEEFLAALSSRYRKAVRRERREALQAGVAIHWLTGEAITEAALDAFFAFYIETGSRKWGRPYLNRAFYSLVTERMRDRIVLIMAERGGRWIAGAINFLGKDTLFGRHWGAIEHHPFLHFEICYYQAIEFAIAHRLEWVEAGAQGEHKVARGYLPVTTRSAHYVADPMLRRAVQDYLVRERAYMDELARDLGSSGPFRRDGNDTAGAS